MARLFSKDYHLLSTSWYFNHAVIALSQGDLWYWHTLDEAGNYKLRFFPGQDKREHFSAYVDVVYDPRQEQILSHHCHECKEEESCRHYLSLLRYAYLYLSTDIFEQAPVLTCDGDSLRGEVRWMNLAHEAHIRIEGIFDPHADKIRFYHKDYKSLDILALLSALNADKETDPEYERNLGVFSVYELQLFEFLHANRAAYSPKGGFWSLYKRDFAAALTILEHLNGKVVIAESSEPLIFAKEPYPLALRIEPAGKDNFRLLAVLVDELSIWYAGYPSWLFFRNQAFKVFLPFKDEVTDKIFSGDMLLSERDLVYYRSIVHGELARKNVYLDFDSRIELPLVIDTPPKTLLKLQLLQDMILMEGFLEYQPGYAIPMAVLKYGKPLIYSSYTGGEEGAQAWFYLPPEVYAKVEALLDNLPEPDMRHYEQSGQLVFAGEEVLEQLKQAVFQLSDQDWEIEISTELRSQFVTRIQLEVEVQATRSEEIDWFSYSVNYRYRDITFTHEELRKYFRSKDDFIHTADGRILFISNPEVFHEMEALVSQSDSTHDNIYRARILALPYYQRLRQENPAFRLYGDEYLETMFKDLQQRRTEHVRALPYYLQTVLRGYQKAGINWLEMLKHYHLGGILADEMGLGKTIQALTIILSAPEDTVCAVICPKTLLYNWAAEIEKFHTNITFAIVEGSKERRNELLNSPNIRLFIMSYSMVLNDLEDLKKHHFEWIVLDEAQNIKNVSAQRTAAIKKLSSSHRLALSGTPIENNMTELWSIMDFLLPGYLGNLKRFKENYLASEDDKGAKLSLNRAVSPFLLRRIKREVLLELPDKQEQISWCKLNPIQEKLYLQIIEMVQKKLMPEGKESYSYVHILAALMKLRQLCNHPSLANEDILPEVSASTKLEQLLELVQESIQSGHKVLVFSQFVQMLQIMRKAFDDLGIRYSYLDGKTKDRVTPVQRFEQDPDLKLFLISLKTGGTGLNLTAADTVILYDPWWNPMVENQAIDRAHRIGQTKKVQVFRLISKGTVEEKILALQKSKLELFNDVIEGGTSVLRSMSMDELKGLFSYP